MKDVGVMTGTGPRVGRGQTHRLTLWAELIVFGLAALMLYVYPGPIATVLGPTIANVITSTFVAVWCVFALTVVLRRRLR